LADEAWCRGVGRITRTPFHRLENVVLAEVHRTQERILMRTEREDLCLPELFLKTYPRGSLALRRRVTTTCGKTRIEKIRVEALNSRYESIAGS
jgi:hypothetical protein